MADRGHKQKGNPDRLPVGVAFFFMRLPDRKPEAVSGVA